MTRTIHLVFKTHLDIGFTDHAEKVRGQYHERFIPQAIDTGEHFFREDPDRPAFIWTTGAWLIWDHLETQPPGKIRRLEEAIGRGLIRWHALPFTTHSELMSPALFRAGLSYAAELDRRFGVRTIAAKMTDVPGHTRGIVPLLAEAGVKFLHLGVNAASRVPNLPDVFRWRAPGGEEILVMYQSSYGETHFPTGLDDGLSFAHTNDNIGPQSVGQTGEAYRALRHANPGTVIKASSLDEYAALLWPRREEFPVADVEIGDSWIHGAGSDPIKLQRFLALQRLYDGFAGETPTPERLAFGRGLTLVAEHTCGVDIKSFLRDETNWDRPSFENARHSDYRFPFTEESWIEQRAYLDHAVAALTPADRTAADEALAALAVPAPSPGRALDRASPYTIGGWTLEIDPQSGALAALTTPTGTKLAGRDNRFLAFSHESYDAADIDRFRSSYITERFEWALFDFGKPGLASASTARSNAWATTLTDVTATDAELTLGLALAEIARDELGAPSRVELTFRPLSATEAEVTLMLREKPANRLPEAGFLTLTAVASDWEFLKLGLWQPGDRIAANAGGNLQAVVAVKSRLADGTALEITPLDTPLVAPLGDFMAYEKGPPDFSRGLRFNLYNNKWGTNFPQWWEGDFRARFRLTLGG
jgi:hypothetical protein